MLNQFQSREYDRERRDHDLLQDAPGVYLVTQATSSIILGFSPEHPRGKSLGA